MLTDALVCVCVCVCVCVAVAGLSFDDVMVLVRKPDRPKMIDFVLSRSVKIVPTVTPVPLAVSHGVPVADNAPSVVSAGDVESASVRIQAISRCLCD